MERKTLLAAILICVLIAAFAVLMVQNINLQTQLSIENANLAQNVKNHEILNFTQEFIDKVLDAKGEVSFDDRLQLENMVRGLNDSAILAVWSTFVNSQTPAAAQQAVKDLLTLLIHKIAI